MKNNEDGDTLNTIFQLKRESQADNNVPNDGESSTNDSNTKLEWTLKQYRVDNDNLNDTELEWIRKKYRVNNDNSNDTVISRILF